MRADFPPYPTPQSPSPFQFGWECELVDPGAALLHYEPCLALPGWAAASTLPEKSLVISAFCRSLGHGDKRAILRKISGPDFLPPELFRDDTGNLEAISPVYDSFASFRRDLLGFGALFAGSWQAMVSVPRELFFAGDAGVASLEHLGWLNFFQEADILARLERGRVSKSREPVRTFLHPQLGPMTALRHQMLRKYLRENAQANLIDPESLSLVHLRERSFKFVGATTYRPDVAAPHRICFEVRDAHRDPELLLERVARLLFYWSRPRREFFRFAALPPFDSAAVYDELPAPLRSWLESVCPNRAPAVVANLERARFAFEVYRNFAYPLRSWGPWLEVLDGDFARVRHAQEAYRAALLSACAENDLGAAQRALAAFAAESGLGTLFADTELAIREKLS